jgi:hypothetical protein
MSRPLCGQNTKLLIIKADGIYSYFSPLKDKIFKYVSYKSQHCTKLKYDKRVTNTLKIKCVHYRPTSVYGTGSEPSSETRESINTPGRKHSFNKFGDYYNLKLVVQTELYQRYCDALMAFL